MSSPTKAHRERALELVRLFAHANTVDLIAAALSDVEATAYARGLADGAERERAAVNNVRAYLERTIANCELHHVAWANQEVLEMVNQILALCSPPKGDQRNV